jgi:tRNA threonylcarbamoyladenosine biosynthesis protein TsaE
VERPVDLIVRSRGPADTATIAGELAAELCAGDVLVLGGDLGAGKTTFTKALGAELGIDQPITSPTFALAQRYESGRLVLHHLDVYRLGSVDEAIDLALPELYESGGVVVIEWGDTIAAALPRQYLYIKFVFEDHDDDRLLHMTAIGTAWQARRPRLRERLADHLADRQDA